MEVSLNHWNKLKEWLGVGDLDSFFKVTRELCLVREGVVFVSL